MAVALVENDRAFFYAHSGCIVARQFNELLDETGLKIDPTTNTVRTVYCLRHTAICMRIILSYGKVNIFNLAKNAGTSVEHCGPASRATRSHFYFLASFIFLEGQKQMSN